MWVDCNHKIHKTMTKLLRAQPLLDARLPMLQAECAELKKQGILPKLTVVLVGNNPASLSYISNKRKMCEKVGADFELRQLDPQISHQQFKDILAAINADKKTHGCIIQLPVSPQLQGLRLEAMVNPEKDVDGFHPQNTADIYLGRVHQKSLIPCTPKGIMSLLHHYEIPVKGKHAVVIGRSQIVGKPMSMLLNLAGATVTNCHSQTPDLKEFTRRADIVVSAVGKVDLLDQSHFDISRQTAVIDVGISKNPEGKLVGDVKFEAVSPLVSAITPVPGGVGPMTVFSLIENLLTATQNQKG
jgi:methylenetetrahydrofolate dehydrogenase (NADP+)/methenyltetrahydrofolate cyclohydrolase